MLLNIESLFWVQSLIACIAEAIYENKFDLTRFVLIYVQFMIHGNINYPIILMYINIM